VVDADALARILKPTAWKPENGERYYVVETDGSPDDYRWEGGYGTDGDAIDRKHYAMGNCFRTETDAEFAAEAQRITVALRRAAEAAGGVDWRNLNSSKFYLRYQHRQQELTVGSITTMQDSLQVYFPSEESAYAAVKAIGADKIVKYLFKI
jgi:hypothetical protein